MHKLVFKTSLVFFCALAQAESKEVTPHAVFDSFDHHFGTVQETEPVSYNFKVTNQGGSDLRIEKVEVSMPGMNFRAKQQIAPGESTDIIVTWNTQGFTKEVKGQVLLYLNDPDLPKAVLSLHGNVVAALDILPFPAVYLSQFNNENKHQTLRFENNQKNPVTIVKLEKDGSHFNVENKVIEKGKSYALTFSVSEDTPVGRYRESAYIHTDDPVRNRIRIEVNILVKPDLFVIPESVDLGQISITKLRTNPSIINLLRETLIINRRIGKMAISPASTDLRFLDIKQEPDNEAEKFRIDVGLKPDKLVIGPINGSIKIKTNDPNQPEIIIRVSGEIIE